MGAATPSRDLVLPSLMVVLAITWFAARSSLVGAGLDAAFWSGAATAAIAFAIVLAVPVHRITACSGALDRIAESGPRSFFTVTGCALVIGAVGATLQQPLSWDEPHLLSSAAIVANDGVAALLRQYSSLTWLGTSHPPLAVLFYGFAKRLLGLDLYGLRLIAVLAGGATAATCLALARQLVAPRNALLGILLLLSSPLFVRMTSAAMNDILVTLCFVSAALLSLRLAIATGRDDVRATRRLGALLGLVVGAGLLTKYTMVLVYPLCATILLAYGKPGNARRSGTAIALAISSLLFALWAATAWEFGIVATQLQWTGRMATQSTRSTRGLGYALDALATKLPSGLGIYNLPLLLFGLARARALEARTVLVLAVWIATVSVPLLLTLPDNRYFLPAYPALALLGGSGLAALSSERARLLALSWLLCGATLVYYGGADLTKRAFLFRALLGGG